MTVPKHWQIVELREVAFVQTGFAKGKVISGESVRLPYLRVANVQDGFLDLSEIKEVEVAPYEIERFRLQIGDVLLTEGGDFDKLGRGTLWRGEITNCLHQNHIFAVRTSREVLDPLFFSYQTASPYGRKYFLECSKQSTNLASINSTQLKEFPVLLPPLPEQRAIATILSTWDEAIMLTERLIAALRRRKQALMQMLLTGEVRFPGFEGAWDRLTVEEASKTMESGGTPSTQMKAYWNGTIPWITGADFEDQKVSQVRRYITTEAVEKSSTKIVSKGNILLVTRTGVGKMALAPFDTAISQDITGITPNEEIITPEYLISCLSWTIPRLARFNQGTSINGITRDDLKMHEIAVPSLKEQEKITDVLQVCDAQIEQSNRILISLLAEKRGLMQQLLTGAIRVGVDE